jgi:class 3 adenylate cyclase/HAMP domain-containing protein
MDERAARDRKPRLSFGLRVKITLTFLVVGAVVSGVLAWTMYRILNQGLLSQVQTRVLDLAQLGGRLVDADALARLAARLGTDLPEDKVDAVERSADFRSISDSLNAVRGIESKLVHYIYLFAPTSDPKNALYVVDGDVLALKARLAAGEKVEDEISHFSSSFDLSGFPVPRRVLADGRPLVEERWSYDPDFHVNSISGYAPIRGRHGEVLAVLGIDMVDTDVRLILSNATRIALYVIAGALVLTALSAIFLGTLFTRGIVSLDRVVRTFSAQNLEVRTDVRSRDEVGSLGGSFNTMADTIQKYSVRLENLLNAYGRFVPKELLRLIGKGDIVDVKLGDQSQRNMTVLFSDIIGFTSLSETMTPKENFDFLNSYLGRMGPEIRAHNGFIDKYIGDAIMALFPETADDALTAAVSMHERLKEYNVHRHSSGYAPIDIGVGVHAGQLMFGTLGTHERMDGSVISDTVNLASRLQSLTRMYGSSVLTTGSTLRTVRDRSRFRFRFIDRVRVRGRKEPILIFEVLDADPVEQRERKLSYRAELARALRFYYGKQFTKAYLMIGELFEKNPEDDVLRIYRRRCETLVTLGAPENWEGVQEIDAH